MELQNQETCLNLGTKMVDKDSPNFEQTSSKEKEVCAERLESYHNKEE